MSFTFTEAVKLAAKGFKPGDIKELSDLDENKFNKEDILSLVANGYSKSDIKKLVETFSSSGDDSDNPNNDTDDNDDHSGKSENEAEHENHDSDNSDETDDNIDYKALYEKEKKLSEKLQHKNAASDSGDPKETKTSEQIAIEVAESILN